MKQFLAKLELLENKVDQLPSAIMVEVADLLVNNSPDDTGAYVLSHSIGRSGAVGRRLDPQNRASAPNTHREAARQGLHAQAAAIKPETVRVWIGNNAPHSNAVENGGHGWSRTSPYKVYAKLALSFPALVQQGKNKVGFQ
jgi:hypothetical protein